jgi:flagellar hook-basal body complex protein FliE
MPRDRDREPDYEIGYRKPPPDTRFKPGVSGNPSGRPKGAKNLTTLVHEALNEPVIVAENGRRRKVSKRQAIIKQLINRSAQGDLKAIQMLLDVMQEIERRQEATDPTATTFDAGDEKVLDQLITRLGKT